MEIFLYCHLLSAWYCIVIVRRKSVLVMSLSTKKFISEYQWTVISACITSGGWVSWAKELWPQLHPKAEEHPQAYQPATQPQAPPTPSHPCYSTCHTEARSPVQIKCTKPRDKEKKKKSWEGEGDPKPRKQREGGEPREMLCY